MSNIVHAFSNVDTGSHIVIYFLDGAQHPTSGIATRIATNTYKFFVPTTFAAGHYAYKIDVSGKTTSTGYFYWDGANVVYPEQLLLDVQAKLNTLTRPTIE